MIKTSITLVRDCHRSHISSALIIILYEPLRDMHTIKSVRIIYFIRNHISIIVINNNIILNMCCSLINRDVNDQQWIFYYNIVKILNSYTYFYFML